MTIKELATILTPIAKEHNATVTIPQEKQERDSIWKTNAKIVENKYNGYVDWGEEFYECPCCGEPVYLCDWGAEALDEFICPICEDIDLEEESKMTIDFSDMKDLEIQEIITRCNNELIKRKNDEKNKLIEAFQVAYENLRDEGIDIYYNGIEEEEKIKHFEDFSFL